MDQPDRFTFTLAGRELDAALAWQREHSCPRRDDPPCAAGERYVYAFMPTGLGTTVKISCIRCQQEHDITDWKQFG